MIGEVLGNYRITDQIGSGGMGLVYEAEHILLGKKGRDQGAQARALREP